LASTANDSATALIFSSAPSAHSEQAKTSPSLPGFWSLDLSPLFSKD